MMSALVRLGTEYRYLGTYLLSVHKVPLLHCAPPAESAPATGDEPHNTKRAGFMLRPVGALPGEHGRDVAMLASSSVASRGWLARLLPFEASACLTATGAPVRIGGRRCWHSNSRSASRESCRRARTLGCPPGLRSTRAWTDIFPRRLPPGQSPLAACPRAEPARKLSGGRARKERAGKLAGRPGWNELDN